MLSRSSHTPILHTWQSDLNYAIEAGIAPVIPLGGTDSTLTSLSSLSLLRELAAQRTDMTTPTVLAGGSNAVWLTALFLNAEAARAGQSASGISLREGYGAVIASPIPIVLFTGVDPAMQVASGGILPRTPAGLQPVTDRGLPIGVRELVAPALQPATPVTSENLPFRILEASGEGSGMPAASLWMGAVAAVMVLIMILGALIV